MYPLSAQVNETYLKSINAIEASKPAVWAMLNFHYGDCVFRSWMQKWSVPRTMGPLPQRWGLPGNPWTGLTQWPTILGIV